VTTDNTDDRAYDVSRPDPLEPTQTGREALEAAFLRHQAASPHREADQAEAEAEAIETALHATLPASDVEGLGPGGEVVLKRPLALDEQARRIRYHQKNPTQVTTAAGLARLRQADSAGCIEPALDMADSIGAKDSFERSLAHQAAAMHNLAMRFAGAALAHLEKALPENRQVDSLAGNVREHAVEASRLGSTAARLSEACQAAALALGKYRSGGSQNVYVHYQQVKVTECGQAVVAGQVHASGKGGVPSSHSAPNAQSDAEPALEPRDRHHGR
jgi:hypothetical protein